MVGTKLFCRISGAALVPVLAFALGSSSAYAQDRDDHRDMQHDYGREHDQRDYGHDRDRGGDRDRGRDFHFDEHHRDADHWRDRRDRVHFMRGERIPYSVRVQPVPMTYYQDVPPPPPGYRYGYYEGYVVAYDPTTRMVGDVLDLVGTAMNR